MTQPVFRFAPSPNGRLHLGHAFSALLNAQLAEAMGGRLLVRIEDIDIGRCRPELATAILDDLAWLGLHWEEPVRRQSAHFDDYRRAIAPLRATRLVYPCFCSRKDIAVAVAGREAQSRAPWPRDPDDVPLYPGTCRGLEPGEAARRIAGGLPHAWRLDTAVAMATAPGPWGYCSFALDGSERRVAARPELWGDPVLVRKEVPTSYHLAVVVDDALQGVTHVVRGVDLAAATDLHVLLQTLLGLPSPRYHHHRLIRDRDGMKLSKSMSSETLADLRERGAPAAEIRRWLGFSLWPAPRTDGGKA